MTDELQHYGKVTDMHHCSLCTAYYYGHIIITIFYFYFFALGSKNPKG